MLDTVAKQMVDNYTQLTAQIKKDGYYLQNVVVKAKLKIPGSKNLNNDGSDQVITGQVLEKTPKKTLLQILQENVKDFRWGTLGKNKLQQYFMSFSIVHFIIDGVDLDDFYYAKNPEELFHKFPSGATPLMTGFYF